MALLVLSHSMIGAVTSCPSGAPNDADEDPVNAVDLCNMAIES